MAESVKVNLRVTPQQRDKLTQLGGAPWVRSQIDAAKAPQPKEKT